ncbi:uncharacterized protein LOC108468326 [Gossypium arboreum]|uniref:uncharacterized protein LOC108468326 n=1 Tax=Gossypium arboreum TaxID=29729 RepID=UPI000819751E|nr:uncharacterized protein LOC108468326 [Gossypium arboreum]
MDANGNVESYKARLVAKGYTQKEGIDFIETFSPVSSKDSFSVIMVLVAHFDLELHQMDVKTMFLNGLLHETKRFLSEHFKMKDLRDAYFVLRIQIHRDRSQEPKNGVQEVKPGQATKCSQSPVTSVSSEDEIRVVLELAHLDSNTTGSNLKCKRQP